ncbi:integrating conjugative element protein [Ectopseudomonas oleovorans]|uniref:Integrating conjugative element protein n=2 Tax=Ectopseudomonas oleovorans TaxID=301 RepID=A0A379KC10_ECTOL|nr:integrating conjugative element protein [Pseudomonas oleovorans]
MYPHSEHVETQRHRLRCRPTLASCMLAMAAAAMAHAAAADVRVFTDRHHAVEAPSGVYVVELDAPAGIEAELAANLPADPAQATAIVQQRLQDGGTPLQQRLADAYQGVTDAWSLGITRIPAVVVDRRYVVYGETDVSRALARIEEYRRTQP